MSTCTRLSTRPRRGRLLLECLVSMLLLSAAGLAMMASTRATALLADDAILVTRAHALSAAAAEHAHMAGCTATDRAVTTALPRVKVEAIITPAGRLQRVQIAASMRFSPLARAAPAELSLSSARLCP